MYKIAVIGAGVIGAMIARELSKYHVGVCLIDKESDVAMGATKANSAIVHAGFDAEEGSLKARFNVKGSEMMKQITDELGVKYQNNGSLVVAFSDEDMETIESLYRRGVNNGVKNLEIIGEERLRELEPAISEQAAGALYAPTGGIVCPYELTVAAIGNAMDNGAKLILDFEVTSITARTGYYEIACYDQKIMAEYVVNAAGLYADRIASMVSPIDFGIHPRKGEYLILDKACGDLANHTIFKTPTKMGKGILVTPTVDGNLLLGPTSVDIEDKDNKETTPEGLYKVMEEAGGMMPDVPLRNVITSFCGLRAVGNRGDFIIEKSVERFFNVAGIESPGLSSAPAIAEYVVELLIDAGVSDYKKENFNPYREPEHAFREAFLEEKNKIIKQDPSYGRMVCRCEGISEGEILHAIRTNPKATNIDAVKRRTRSGMGRCQGGFCMPLVAELISKELDIPLEKVTKSGKNSRINIGKMK